MISRRVGQFRFRVDKSLARAKASPQPRGSLLSRFVRVLLSKTNPATNLGGGTEAALSLSVSRTHNQAWPRTGIMKRRIGDCSRKRRLRGDSRAEWYAIHRAARFSRR